MRTLSMRKLALPTLISCTVALILLPRPTVGKFTGRGNTNSPGATPIPVTRTVSRTVGPLWKNTTSELNGPSALGMKVTLKVFLNPGGIAALVGLIVNSKFDDVTSEISRGDVPEFVTVMLSCFVVPTRTFPNARTSGFAENPATTPVPVADTVSGEPAAL